jgi:uncharacterized protein YkwD
VRTRLGMLHLALPILALAAGLLGAPSAAWASGPIPPGWPFGVLRPLTPSALADEDRIVELVNAERARAGLAPLTRQAQLAAAAGDYAVTIAGTGSFSHDAVDGSRLQERGEAHGYFGWTFRGENLAAGQDSPERVVRAWMDSPTHRANVLAAQACEIGVGRASARGTRYDTYWVMEIGCGLFSAT